MSLRDRLAISNGPGTMKNGDSASRDQRDRIIRNLHFLIIDEMGEAIDSAEAGTQRLRSELEAELQKRLAAETVPLSYQDRRDIVDAVIDNILGYGPLESLLADPSVTEIMVNNPEAVYIERAGHIHLTDRRFIDESHLLRIVDKIASEVGRRIDESSPMVDARLPDGSRVNAVIHPLAINGPMLTIRKFSTEPFTDRDLVNFGTLTDNLATFLDACVRGKLNILISGGTGTGKTTLLNVVSQFVPGDERIVTIEDSAELRLHQSHVLRLESRPPNLEGRGEVTIRDLVRNSLRMRPDRIIVGEVRGGETLDMLQAMNTGHEGSLSTVHSNSPRDALSRLETMVMMAGFDLPVRAIREQAASALDLIVHLSRLRDGSRRVTHVSEVEGMEGDTVVLQDIFYFDFSAGVDESGTFLGRVKATGLRPKFTRKLEDQGIELPAGLFEFEPPVRA